MAPQKITPQLWSWASDLEASTRQQAERTSRLPIVAGHVALMPDAHLGLGATVGSVVPTEGAIIPACVGVDIGCGMAAVRTDLVASDLPDDLTAMLGGIATAIPAGMGRGHTGRSADARAERRSKAAAAWLRDHQPRTDLDPKQATRTQRQLGLQRIEAQGFECRACDKKQNKTRKCDVKGPPIDMAER